VGEPSKGLKGKLKRKKKSSSSARQIKVQPDKDAGQNWGFTKPPLQEIGSVGGGRKVD